jgi:hypothetical protein
MKHYEDCENHFDNCIDWNTHFNIPSSGHTAIKEGL